MKRLCFDIESDYFKSPISGVGDVQYHRELAEGKSIRFDCGVVYDDSTGEHHEFNEDAATQLVEMLMSADELISHSGQRHDLVVLERVCGPEAVTPLWQKLHHDLFDIYHWKSLDDLSVKFIPAQRLREIELAYNVRLREADERWPEFRRNCRPHENSIEYKLAKARLDVDRTYEIFKADRK